MSDWNTALANEPGKPYFKQLEGFIQDEYTKNIVYPPQNLIYNALNLTKLSDVKCVILGQDPYHEPGQAMGLAFSVPIGISLPRSLQNIYKELKDEYGYYIPNNGDLTPWAKQGVLLLNTVLTVRDHDANSHANHGWEQYTDAILNAVNNEDRPIVYMLWGNNAKAKAQLITNKRHLVLQTTHPSPYSARFGFLGCGHFKKCNEFLMTCGQKPINWQIEDV